MRIHHSSCNAGGNICTWTRSFDQFFAIVYGPSKLTQLVNRLLAWLGRCTLLMKVGVGRQSQGSGQGVCMQLCSICMQVCVYVCACVFVCARERAHYAGRCVYVYMCACVCVLVYKCLCNCVLVRMLMCVCVCVQHLTILTIK